MDEEAVKSIALVIAAVVAATLALTQAMGGLLMYLVEAVKATGLIRPGWHGVVAIFLGIILGGTIGSLTYLMADIQYGIWTMLLLGSFSGMLMGAGAIKTYKAVGEVNPSAPIFRDDITTQIDEPQEETSPGSDADYSETLAELAQKPDEPSTPFTFTEPVPEMTK